METLLKELRFGFRMLRKSPGFTLAAVISLALGIGANTAIFSVINAVLIKQLPYNDPESLVLLWGKDAAEGTERDQVSFTDVEDWRKQSSAFEEITAYTDWRPILSGVGEAERVPAMQVGDGYFRVMKAEPILGRAFTPEEQQDGKDFVIILGYGLWQRQFGRDPGVVGKTVYLNSRPYTVVGVMPESFEPLPSGAGQSSGRDLPARGRSLRRRRARLSPPPSYRPPKARRRHQASSIRDDADRRPSDTGASAIEHRLQRSRSQHHGRHSRRASRNRCCWRSGPSPLCC